MRKLDFGLADIGQFDADKYAKAQRIVDRYRSLAGAQGINMIAAGLHNGEPYVLFGVYPNTLEPEKILPDEDNGIPLYYIFGNPEPIRAVDKVRL